MSRRSLVLALEISFLAGSVVGMVVPRINPFGVYVAMLLASLAIIFLWRHAAARRGALIVALCALGIFRSALVVDAERHLPHPPLNQKQVFHGIIRQEPFFRGAQQVFNLAVEDDRTQSAQPSLSIRIRTDLYPTYAVGDELKITCTPRAQRFTEAPICYYPEIIHQGSRGSLGVTLQRLRSTLVKVMEENLGQPTTSLVAGMLVGTTASFSEELRSIFSLIGLSHIVAVSGYNVLLVIIALAWCVRYLPFSRRGRWAVIVGGVIVFVLLTGASAATTRAAIMGLLAFSAPLIGRAVHTGALICGAAALMTFVSPHLLVSDLSFQLSFLATIGLVFIAPILQQGLFFMPSFLREVTAQTSAALLATTPLILISFKTISLIALLANIIIVPFVPLVMGMGVLWSAGIFFLSFIPHAENIIAFIGYPLRFVVQSIVMIATSLSKIPFASVRIEDDAIRWGLCVFLYGVGCALLVVAYRRVRSRRLGFQFHSRLL
jgi:ComEC/Rec2-related protein